MRIKRKISQYRRDFVALYECDHCGTTVEGRGYDDVNFHQNAIPAMVCPVCKKTADPATPKTAPDVPAHVVL